MGWGEKNKEKQMKENAEVYNNPYDLFALPKKKKKKKIAARLRSPSNICFISNPLARV